MTSTLPFRARVSERFACDIAVGACTTLENRPARVVDVSEHGAQVRIDEPYDAGTRIHLDVDGEFVWATVQWTEVDRIGVKFMSPLHPTHRLMRIVEDQRRRAATIARPVGVRGFGRRAA
jgi:hypothetical protein